MPPSQDVQTTAWWSPQREPQSPPSHPSVYPEISKPNPQSQSLSRGYGSILPTSLIYIVLSTRGCTPWRPEAVMSTTRGANKSRHWIFTGRRKRTGRHKKYAAFPVTEPYRRAIRFQGPLKLLKRKENSSRGSRQRLQFRLCYHSLSTSWFGNINPIPFR